MYALTVRSKASALGALAFAFLLQVLSGAASAADAPPFAIQATRSDPERPVRPQARRYRGPIFDTHAHLSPLMGQVADANAVLFAMQAAEVTRLVLLPTPNMGRVAGAPAALQVMNAVRQAAGGAVSILCGGDLTAWMISAQLRPMPDEIERQMTRLAGDLRSGACAGVGEIGFRHYVKAPGELLIYLPQSYPPLLAIAAAAAQAGVPLDLHAEPVEPRGTRHEAEVFATVAALFTRNPELKLILAHTGMTSAGNARALLGQFPTLMMNVNVGAHKGLVSWVNLEPVADQSHQLYEDWAVLFEEMPHRFMIGTDFFFTRPGNVMESYENRIHHVRQALGSLTSRAARRIAFDNAERVYGRQTP